MIPSLDEAKQIADTEQYRRIPVAISMLSDSITPVEAMRRLKHASRECFLLESAEHECRQGRYSILGFQPELEITLSEKRLRIRGKENTAEIETEHPEDEIRKLLKDYESAVIPSLPPFSGGLVGFFSYDYIMYSEPVLYKENSNGTEFPELDLMLFDKAIVFDHYQGRIYIVGGVYTNKLEQSYSETEKKLFEIKRILAAGEAALFPPLSLKEKLSPRFSESEYTGMVEKARSYIHEGDIFQVVLSNPQSARAEGSLFDVYRLLRASNPSPYMFYFTSDSTEVAGASPETLVKKEGSVLHTYPLAGTRPRGQSDAEDTALEEGLLKDEKELAEHNMLVDLGRNDLGKVSKIGSVKVTRYLDVLRFSHVMHIGSEIESEICDDMDAFDAIASVLPAGTLSGAPKIRACEIIRELEAEPRGLYGGAIGYIDFAGNMDMAIAIRLAYMKKGRITIQSGAGIVNDSVPRSEYQECINKAKAVAEAVKQAEGGIE